MRKSAHRTRYVEAMRRLSLDDPMPPDPDLVITPLKGEPKVIDEIVYTEGGALLGGIHIERMGKHGYFFRLGQATFDIRSKSNRGPGLEIVAEDVPGYPEKNHA